MPTEVMSVLSEAAAHRQGVMCMYSHEGVIFCLILWFIGSRGLIHSVHVLLFCVNLTNVKVGASTIISSACVV